MTGQAPYYGSNSFMRAGSTINEKTQVAILGCAFDQGVTNRPGARFGPNSIRHASAMLCDGHNPYYRNDPISQELVVDLGNIDINPNGVDAGLASIVAASAVLGKKCKPLYLGGDHTISLAALEHIHSLHGPVALVHFDAHCDFWPENFGQQVGHGSVFYHAINRGYINPLRMIQIGIRSPVSNDVFIWGNQQGITTVSANSVHCDGVDDIAELVYRVIGDQPVYLSIDIDAFDPSCAPGTGTPEIGGLHSWQALMIMQQLKKLNWVGGDLVEVSPPYDHADITSLLAATLAWNMCSLFTQRHK
jgi:agmatinase